MAKPIEPTPILEGGDASRFLEEKKRMDSLDPNSSEYKRLFSLGKECIELFNNKPF